MENNLIEQINPSGLCKISMDDGDNWLNGIITYINQEKNIAEIFVSAKYFNNFFNNSDSVMVKSRSGNNEILFTGKVDRKVISMHKQAIIVKIDSVISFWNNRKYERFDVNYPASIKSNSSEDISVVVNNISFGGIEIFSHNNLGSESDTISIEIITSPNKTLCFTGKIIRCNPTKNGYGYAIQIEDIDKQNIEMLDKLLEYLSLNTKYVSYELKLFKKLKYAVYAISLLIIGIVAVVALFTSVRRL